MKVKVRFVKKKLKSLEGRLDNGIVKSGQIIAPEYAWSVQRKFGFLGRWNHWIWQKKYPSHLEFLQQELDTRGDK